MLDINELKTLIGISEDNLDYDNILNIIISSVVTFTENYTGLKLGINNKIVKYLGNNDLSMYLNEVPIISINSVNEYPMLNNQTVLANDITDIIQVLDNTKGIVYRNDGFVFSLGYLYEFDITFGIDELPSDLKYAMYMLAVSSYGLIDNVKQGVSRLTTPDGTVSYSFNLLPNSIREIFDIYKIRII